MKTSWPTAMGQNAYIQCIHEMTVTFAASNDLTVMNTHFKDATHSSNVTYIGASDVFSKG